MGFHGPRRRAAENSELRLLLRCISSARDTDSKLNNCVFLWNSRARSLWRYAQIAGQKVLTLGTAICFGIAHRPL